MSEWRKQLIETLNQSPKPLTALQLATALGANQCTMRRRLEKLGDEGLLKYEIVSFGVRGPKSRAWSCKCHAKDQKLMQRFCDDSFVDPDYGF